jgi:hypothetical protein
MKNRLPAAQQKPPGSGNPRGEINPPDLQLILPIRAIPGQGSYTLAVTPIHSAEADEPRKSCFTKRTLCEFLVLSERTFERLLAQKLVPAPDFSIGNSPRWTPTTIERWMATRPRLRGRRP